MRAKILGGQTDFSGGEFDPEIKRSDDANQKSGGRQCSNWRILNSKKLNNRPGRSVLYVQSGRTEEIIVAPGSLFKLSFGGDGSLSIRNSANALVASRPSRTYAWQTATLQQIVYSIVPTNALVRDVVITFPGQQPQVARYTIGGGWSFFSFAFNAYPPGGLELPFFRLTDASVTLQPSAITGSITLTASAPAFNAGQVGEYIRWGGCQIQLTVFTDNEHVTGTVLQQLPYSCTVTTASGAISGFFTPGDVVTGSASGYQAVVVSWSSPTLTLIMLKSGELFQGTGGSSGPAAGEIIVGPNGIMVPSNASPLTISVVSPQPSLIWDEQVIGAYRGWPQSCFFDQDRLGFCNLPALPNGILWSAEADYSNFYVGANPTDPIFETAPTNQQVLFVQAGPESAEFVFCSNAIYYIPISPINPLKPGSVGFQLVSQDGAASNVQPRAVQEVIVYMNAGLTSLMTIVATGAYNRPFETRDLSELHSHLLSSPVAIAIPTTTSGFPERYGYVLNSNGTIAVFKYETQSGQIKGQIGWTPWNGGGTVQWISALNADVLFSSVYFGQGVVEIQDNTQYLDSALPVNNAPASIAPPGGNGPLWFIPNQTVTLLDLSTRQMGTYQIDANGFIIPQNIAGENLLSSQLVAGQPWTAIFEPFAPDANSGNSMGQRLFKRRVARFAVYVMNSTGFLMARLFSGPITPTSPALGTIMNNHRVTTYNQGDDATKAPPLREEAQRWRPLGRSFDPRVAVIKDTPGPLTIAEVTLEVSI